MADRVDEVADRLYGLPLEDFTRERDAAARELRREKARDEAAEVGRLPKPGAGPWAVNAIAREQPALRDELLEAGEELRSAQDAALAGRGAKELRAASARERAAVDAVLDAAAKLRPGGRKLSGAALDRLRRTLHAAAGDEQVRAAIAAGRLVGEAEGGGAWPFSLGGDDDEAAAPAAAKKQPAAAAKKQPAAKAKAKAKAKATPAAERRAREAERATERKAAEREAAARREAEREAAARRLELERQLASARRERTRRERELTAAEREAGRAADRLAGARDAAEKARHAVARVEEQLD
ncbi:MAG: hypothetical protein QOF17_1148 [Solirubrobacteraceae bacterium]|nr:hypothetical protein [Solirubrobacteraceae bacterium]